MKQVILPGGPHLRTAQTTRNMMFHVALSLVPALLGAIYFFGNLCTLSDSSFRCRVCDHRISLAKTDRKTDHCRRFQRSRYRNAPCIQYADRNARLGDRCHCGIQHPIRQTNVWRYRQQLCQPCIDGAAFRHGRMAGHCHAVHRPPHASGGRRIFGNCTWNSQERWGSRLQLSPDVSR